MPRAAISRILQSSSSLSRTRNSIDPDIQPAFGTIVAASVPNAKVKTETNLRNDENLLKNALNNTILYMNNVVMKLHNMYNELKYSPMPEKDGIYLNDFTAAWNSAFDEGIKIQRLLNIVISNGMVNNNHAGIAEWAYEVHQVLLLNNLSMDTARSSVENFLNNTSYYNPELVLLSEAINKTELLVNDLNNTVHKLNVLRDHVNTMISNQEEPRRAQTIPMGVPASQ